MNDLSDRDRLDNMVFVFRLMDRKSLCLFSTCQVKCTRFRNAMPYALIKTLLCTSVAILCTKKVCWDILLDVSLGGVA